jgi:3-hydroxyisobutyrate dehydrogenase
MPVHEQPGAWLSAAGWVLSCVTGAQAGSVADQALAFAAPGAGLVDLTTARPEVKRRAAHLAAARGVRYADAAIMGAISLQGARTALLVAGPGAEAFQALFTPIGARVQVITGGAAGEAISLKMLRSIFTKGMEALCVELLLSAEKQGVREKLYDQLADIDQTPLREFMDMLVRTHVVHARRRAHEVRDAQSELAAQGLPSRVLPGVEQRFNDTAQMLERQPVGADQPSVEQALQWLMSQQAPGG